MIDWWNVFTNSLWIIGLAQALAVFSYVDWQASTAGQSPGATVAWLTHNSGFVGGMALVCLGAGLGASPWWERVLWLLFAGSLVSLATWLWLGQRRGSAE
jgi:hypothetical protein